jgi:hypothetical protein
LLGSLFSANAPDRVVRPAITFVVAASGLKYVGVGTTALGWILCATLLAGAVLWAVTRRPWAPSEAVSPSPTDLTRRPTPHPDPE